MDLQPFFDKLSFEEFKDHCFWEDWDYRDIFQDEGKYPGKLFHDGFDALRKLTREAIVSSEQPKKYVIAKSCWILMFLTLPTCIWYKSPEEPPEKKSRQDYPIEQYTTPTYGSEIPRNTRTQRSPNYLNEFHYITFSDDSNEMTPNFFTEKLEELKKHFTEAMAQTFMFEIPRVEAKPETELDEAAVEAFLSTYLYNPLKILIEILYGSEEFDRIRSKTYNFPAALYYTQTDRAFRFKGQTLVVIKLKAPDISKYLSPEKRKGPHFIRMVTQVFYQATSAGTPYAILSDGFTSMLFMIGPNPEVKVSQTPGIVENDLKAEDIHLPVQFEYYVINHETPRLTAAACHAVFFNLAYDVLINQGQLEKKQKEMWALNKRCKMSDTEKERRFNVQYNRFLGKFEKSFAEYQVYLDQLNMAKETLTLPVSNFKDRYTSKGLTHRNAQVYATTHNHILKVYDPFKAPDKFNKETVTRTRAEKIALYSIKKELLAYSFLRGLECVPDLVEYGFAKLKADSIVDNVVGPYLIMKDVGGFSPDLESKDVVDRVLTAYKALVERGVLHGDLKDSNIRMVGDKVVFLDFGVSDADQLLVLLQKVKGKELDDDDKEMLRSHVERDVNMVTSHLTLREADELRTKHKPILKKAYRKRPNALKSLQETPAGSSQDRGSNEDTQDD